MASAYGFPTFPPVSFPKVQPPYFVHVRGYTLVEMLVTIVVIALLVTLLLPVANKALLSGQETDDLARIKSYGMAIQSMANDLSRISSDDVLHFNASVEPYTGGAAAANRFLNSKLWTRQTRANGNNVSNTTRSYTLNQIIFPPKTPSALNPSPQPWEIDSTTPTQLRAVLDKPLLYTGVYFAAHNGAYVWGSRSHANPIYSRLRKESPTNTIQGRTVVLFVGGHARIVNFATENLPTTGPNADPEKWWQAAN